MHTRECLHDFMTHTKTHTNTHAQPQERLDASKLVDASREAQRRLADAVRAWTAQGVPIPFAMEVGPGGDLGISSGSVMGPVYCPNPDNMPRMGQGARDQSRPLRGGHYAKGRAQAGGVLMSPGRGRNSRLNVGQVSDVCGFQCVSGASCDT